MYVENANTDTTLIKSECYICMELCSTNSPCECKSHVHPKCLVKFIETSGNTHCTICNGQYPVAPPVESNNNVIISVARIIFLVGLFFPFGWFGTCILDKCEYYDPFSLNSCFTAFSFYFVIFVIRSCITKRHA